jgi:hypothetical protein
LRRHGSGIASRSEQLAAGDGDLGDLDAATCGRDPARLVVVLDDVDVVAALSEAAFERCSRQIRRS